MSEQVLIHLAQMTFGAFPFFVLVIAFPSGDIVTFFTGGGQPVCQQSGRNSYWCLWDIRIGDTAGIDSVRARQKAREFFPTPFFLDFVRERGF